MIYAMLSAWMPVLEVAGENTFPAMGSVSEQDVVPALPLTFLWCDLRQLP